MADQNKDTSKKMNYSEQESKQPEKKLHAKDPRAKQEELVKLVRILQKDIRGDKKAYRGICSIKGVSWAFSNAVFKITGINKNTKIQDLTQEEIKKIEGLISNPVGIPIYMQNRRKDRDDGKDKHIYGADLDLQVDFDIKRLKKIKAYKGVRHQLGQPVRGQRTKSHFRKNKKKSGMGASTKPAVSKTAAPVKEAKK